MKILVTGHLGYIGTLLVPMLLEKGHEVTGMDADWYSRCTFGDARQIVRRAEHPKDIRQATVSDLRGFDTVMHLAALSNDPLGNYNPQLTDEINHNAAVRLGEMAKQAGVKHFIFSSTCSNYGVAGNEFIDENGQLQPVHAIRQGQSRRRAGAGAAERQELFRHAHAQRYRVRIQPAHSLGPGAEQPDGARGDDGQDPA